ncbi:MAG TPA: DUF4147 domain-containing protein [Thermoplasmata archaeon]|nr:DUF4147 domain-containing protein [Thermoplasmata archaeon]
MASRFPGEPFSPDRLPDPVAPVEGVDAVFPAIYRAAVVGADSYRATRSALRRDGPILRLGNRFVSLDRFREIAFLALGSASISQTLAATSALGESITQGLVIGPDALPTEVPFHHRVVPVRPSPAVAESAAAEALELARGLGERDLLIVLLSAGATGYLSEPPAGIPAAEWADRIREFTLSGASSRESALLVRVLGLGGVGGRLAGVTRAETAALVVDRGDGAELVGGGPTCAVTAEERVELRAALERTGHLTRLPPALRGELTPAATALPGGGPSFTRPVSIIGPADALREAGEAAQAKRWKPMLADLHLAGDPGAAATRMVTRTEELFQSSPPTATPGRSRPPRGLATFAATTLAVPEGGDEGAAIDRFLAAAAGQLPWRGASVAALRTAGAPSSARPPGAVRRVGTDPRGRAASGIHSLRMRPGVTDVGVIVVCAVPATGAE